jgi:ABC-2 type transport system ATP-binding protein
MANAAIRTESLSKIYKGDLGHKSVVGLENLALEVGIGEVYAFLGPNGAGKTTTIKLITRLLFPSQGKIWIFDAPNTSRRSMAKVGYLPEQPNFYGYLSGVEFLDFIGRLFGLDSRIRKSRSRDLLETVGLGDKGGRLIRTYSRGMVQRLGMAQALINEPELVILDEPMSALDPVGRKDFRDLILGLKRRNKTVFFSSHILSDAEMVADRVGILKNGRLVSTGKLEELIGPRAGVELTFTHDSPKTAAAAMGIPDAVVQNQTVMVRLDPDADLSDWIRKIEKHRGKLVSVVPVRKSLEDLFMSQIGR